MAKNKPIYIGSTAEKATRSANESKAQNRSNQNEKLRKLLGFAKKQEKLYGKMKRDNSV
ncbi:hypothetical protein [Bacillus sp. 1P06AnD]|uniref:hypothetical protein n=1 Tax=Bacillus sp. 1P06AnD TaxID=3132208 RepID=UPI00399F62EB